MTMIAMPASVRIRRVQWSLDRPAQVNESAYTGAQRVVANPWHGKWSAHVELAPIVGEAGARAWRSFLAKLKGQINAFQLPATEGAQYAAGSLNLPMVDRGNTTVTNVGGGVYTVSKSAGVNGTYDASATSSGSTAFVGDFVMRVRFTNVAAGGVIAGPSTSVTASNNYLDILRAVGIDTSGNLYPYESGTQGPAIGVVTSSDYVFIQRKGAVLAVLQGSTTDITQARVLWAFTPSTASFFFDSSIAPSGGSYEVFTQGTNPVPTVASGGAQGATSLVLTNAPAASIVAGMLATVALPSGNRQLVQLTRDMAAATLNFEPPLRESAAVGAVVEIANPFAQVALADSAFAWSVDPGTQYGLAFDCKERF